MNTNLNPQIPAARSWSSDGWATVAGIIGSALLLAKKFLTQKAAKPELMSRAEFYAELLATRERINATHLAILDKLDANQRELLAALDRLASRVAALEAGFARLDERTKVQSLKS
ncbi:MAG: hypothetical protein NT154_26390 [Verrucomicrobia bacterium]|nr:hypothetical protein [Verrucomicrobiota bacterium]